MTSKGAKLIGFLRALVEFIKSYGDIAPSDGTNSGTGDPNHDENDQRNHSHNWKEDVYRIQSHHWVLIGLSLYLSEQLLSVLIGRLLVSDECPHWAVSTGSIDIVERPLALESRR